MIAYLYCIHVYIYILVLYCLWLFISFQQCFIPATKQDRYLLVEDSHTAYIA